MVMPRAFSSGACRTADQHNVSPCLHATLRDQDQLKPTLSIWSYAIAFVEPPVSASTCTSRGLPSDEHEKGCASLHTSANACTFVIAAVRVVFP
jgi:hypothetical protein